MKDQLDAGKKHILYTGTLADIVAVVLFHKPEKTTGQSIA